MKILVISSLIIVFFLSLFMYQKTTLEDQKLHMTVCDVGQGDAIHIRTPNGMDMLYDGGPDEKVLDCLFGAMPFWDRKIELVILSHPHADHLNGLIDVLRSYKVERFVTEELANTTDGYSELEKMVRSEGISMEFVVKGDKIRTNDGVVLNVLSPTKEYLSISSTNGKYISKSGEFANLIIHVVYKEFDVLLTGDSQAERVNDAILGTLGEIEVLQVPHHGSRSGLKPEILDVLSPELTFISVGIMNDYGHPHPSILQMLSREGVTIHRTDKDGTLKLKSDGKSYNKVNHSL